MQETQVWSCGKEDPLESEMRMHSSILAWRIPWTEEPGGLQSMEMQRVGHDWARACTHASGMYMCPPQSPNSSHGLPFPPEQSHVCSLPLCLYLCFTNKIICTIFLDRDADGPRTCHRVWNQEDKHPVIMHVCELTLLHTQLPTIHQSHDPSAPASFWLQRLYLRAAGLHLDSLDSPGSLDFKVTVCTESSVLQWVQEKSPSLSSFFFFFLKGENSNF